MVTVAARLYPVLRRQLPVLGVTAAVGIGGAAALVMRSADAQVSTQTYCGRHFDDRNLDGIQQADEPSRPNVRITVVDVSGVVRYALTGPSGEFCVQSVPIGTHTVRFDDQPNLAYAINVTPTGVQTVAAGRGASSAASVTTTSMAINPDLPLGRPISQASTTLAATTNQLAPMPPTTARPATTRPTTTRPTTTRPATTLPATTKPEPATTRPVTTVATPTTAAERLALAETTKPSTTKPATTKAPTTKPATTKPATTKPPTTKPARALTTTAAPTTVAPTTVAPTTAAPTTAAPTTTAPDNDGTTGATKTDPSKLAKTGSTETGAAGVGLLTLGLGLAVLVRERRRYRARHLR